MRNYFIILTSIVLMLFLSSCNDEEKCQRFSEELMRKPELLDSLVEYKSEMIHSDFYHKLALDSIQEKEKNFRIIETIQWIKEYVEKFKGDWRISKNLKYCNIPRNCEGIKVVIDSKNIEKYYIIIRYLKENGKFKFHEIEFITPEFPTIRYIY